MRSTTILTDVCSLGPASGPFLMGFVTFRAGWHWIYWTLVIVRLLYETFRMRLTGFEPQVNVVQFVLYIPFGPETRYVRSTHQKDATATPPAPKSTTRQGYFNFTRIDPEPLRFYDFYQPILLASKASIFIPAISYAIIFNFSSVL